MLNKILLFILIALVAVQSVDAMADAVKFHQPNTAFSEADYFPVNTYMADNKASPAQNNKQVVDDDHCCYCHGVNCADLIDNSLAFYALHSKERSLFFNNDYRSTNLSPDLRPPII